jgi:hypothetical protein
MIRRAIAAALALWAAPAAAGTPPPHLEPTRGNQYVSVTADQLFVVWSLPRDLAPIAPVLADREALEALVARTAVHLCALHRAEQRSGDKPCKVQILRLKSNDEYSKSAAGGFDTVGKLVLPAAKATPEALEAAKPLKRDDLVAWFTRFDLKHEQLK